VLVVEDDLLILHLSSASLRQNGLDVIEAESADKASDLLREIGHAIAVVFSDIRTPGTLDGMDLAHAIQEGWPTITVVLTSGAAAPSITTLPDKTRFIPKPYDLGQVSKLIAELSGSWLSKSRSPRRAGAGSMLIQ